jgi:SOS-response transcriptional repressor LexA
MSVPSMTPAVEPGTCVDSEPFALQVTDDSMEPEFERGCIVVIDPTGAVKDGAYVFVEVNGEHVFRKLRVRGKRVRLEALNEGYPALEPSGGIAAVKGVVVQRAGIRRRYHKRYD